MSLSTNLPARAKRKLVASGVLDYYGRATNGIGQALFLCHALKDIQGSLGNGLCRPEDFNTFARNRPELSIPGEWAADFTHCHKHLSAAITEDINLHVSHAANTLIWHSDDYDESGILDTPDFFHNRLAYLQFLLLDYVDNGAAN